MRGPVRVSWSDASCDHGETDGTPPDGYGVDTFGMIVSETAMFTSVAAEVLPNGLYRCVTHIPSGLIPPGGIVDLEEGDR